MTFDATINLKAEDHASPVVDSATKNILANWKVMRAEVRATTAEFQLQNQTLVAGANAFRSIGSVASSAMNIFTQFQTMQIALTNAKNNLILAQLRYNQVLAMEGPGTNDAIAASIQLQEAQTSVNQQLQQSVIGYIGMGIEMGGMVGQMIQTIPTLERFALKLGLIKDAAAAAGAASGSVGAAAGGAGAAAGAGAASGAAGVGAAGVAAGGAGKLSTAIRGGGIVAGGAIGADILTQMFPENPLTKFREQNLQGPADKFNNMVVAGIEHGMDRLSNLFQGKGFVRSGSSSSQVEHVVTIKIDNATDHRITATEKSMGIEQVMGSGQ